MGAPRILWRYILRDVALHSSIGLAAFALLLVVQNLMRFLDELVAAGVSFGEFASLIGIILPTYLSYAIPTALLFGVLISLARMSSDGEIVALGASGIGIGRLLPPVLLLAGCAAAASGYTSFEIEPRSYEAMKHLVRQLGRSVMLSRAGEFHALGDRLVYVHAVGDEKCPLSGVLIADASVEGRAVYVAARCGGIDEEAEGEALSLHLEEGSIHLTETHDERYRQLRFGSMRTSIDMGAWHERARRARYFTFRELLALRAAYARGEGPKLREEDPLREVEVQLHRRAAFAFSSVVLAMLAVPLGIRPLRSGRSWGALLAAALMGLYWILFSVGELVAERGWLPAGLALWAPNVGLLALSIWLLRRAARGEA
jgi:lipopolysaccharide export system permease protein